VSHLITTQISLEAKAALMGAAAMLSVIRSNDSEEASEEMLRANVWAENVLNQMVLGNLPIITFEDPQEVLDAFIAHEETAEVTTFIKEAIHEEVAVAGAADYESLIQSQQEAK